MSESDARQRVTNWDLLRFVAFVDVSVFHMTGDHGVLAIGLPLLLTIRFALASRFPEPEGPRAFFRRRVLKVLVAWAAWSTILGAIRIASGIRRGEPLGSVFEPLMLLYGPSIHLWFLPFVALGAVLVHLLDRATQGLPTPRLVAGCGIAALATGVVASLETGLPVPLPQWLFGLPSLFLGLGIGRMLARCSLSCRSCWLGLLAAGLGVTGLARLAFLNEPLAAVESFRYGLAVALIAGAVLLPASSGGWSRRLTPLLLGAYVLHPTVYAQTAMRVSAAGGIPVAAAIMKLATIPLTLLLVAGLRRTPARAIL